MEVLSDGHEGGKNLASTVVRNTDLLPVPCESPAEISTMSFGWLGSRSSLRQHHSWTFFFAVIFRNISQWWLSVFKRKAPEVRQVKDSGMQPYRSQMLQQLQKLCKF